MSNLFMAGAFYVGSFIAAVHPWCLLRAQTPTVTSTPAHEVKSQPPVASELVKPLEPSAPVLRVTCEHDELTVVAAGATLRNVLSAIQGCTGIAMLVPDDMKDEKSYIRLGPSLTLTALEELLDSTELNFVIQPASPTKHRGITVMLVPRIRETRIASDTGIQESGSAASMTAARRAWMATRVAGRSASAAMDDTNAAIEGSDVATSDAAAQEPPRTHGTIGESDVPSSGPTKQNGVSNPAGESGEGATAAPSANLTVSPATPDPAQPPSPDAVRAKQIEDMRNLFEDRKKQMSTTVPATTPPN